MKWVVELELEWPKAQNMACMVSQGGLDSQTMMKGGLLAEVAGTRAMRRRWNVVSELLTIAAC